MANYSSGSQNPKVTQHQAFQPGVHITSKLPTNPGAPSRQANYSSTIAQRHMYNTTQSARESVSNSLNNPNKMP